MTGLNLDRFLPPTASEERAEARAEACAEHSEDLIEALKGLLEWACPSTGIRLTADEMQSRFDAGKAVLAKVTQ